MSLNFIVNPVTLESHSIFSKQGVALLKNYVKDYQTGGALANNTLPENEEGGASKGLNENRRREILEIILNENRRRDDDDGGGGGRAHDDEGGDGGAEADRAIPSVLNINLAPRPRTYAPMTDEVIINTLKDGLSFEVGEDLTKLTELSDRKPVATGNFGDKTSQLVENLEINRDKISSYLENIYGQTDLQIYFVPNLPNRHRLNRMIFYKPKIIKEILDFIRDNIEIPTVEIPTVEQMLLSIGTEEITEEPKKTLMNILFNNEISDKDTNDIYQIYLNGIETLFRDQVRLAQEQEEGGASKGL